jgi:tetrapyrrole methylase family protein/MazG family protein
MNLQMEIQSLLKKDKYDFKDLIKIMEILRKKCPWDKKQTFDSLIKYLKEETYELIEAIIKKDYKNIKEELGDLLLQVVFYSQIAKECGLFDINEVIDFLCKKLIRRHPHVFNNMNLKNEEEVLKNWEKIKTMEKKEKVRSVLDNIPKTLDPLQEAYELQTQAAKYKFDWPNKDLIIEKVKEELNELLEAIKKSDKEKIEEEIGDLLFVIVNLSRYLKIDPSLALKKSNLKFKRRFQYIEKKLKEHNLKIGEEKLEILEKFYQEAKEKEKIKNGI